MRSIYPIFFLTTFVAGVAMAKAGNYNDLVGFLLAPSAQTTPAVKLREGERLLVFPGPSPVPGTKGLTGRRIVALPLDAQKNLDFSRKTYVAIDAVAAERAVPALLGESGAFDLMETCIDDINMICPDNHKFCKTRVYENPLDESACNTHLNFSCLISAPENKLSEVCRTKMQIGKASGLKAPNSKPKVAR